MTDQREQEIRKRSHGVHYLGPDPGACTFCDDAVGRCDHLDLLSLLDREREKVADVRDHIRVFRNSVHDWQAIADREREHHDEHHQVPVRCERDGDGYAHGGLSLCVTCAHAVQQQKAELLEALRRIRAVVQEYAHEITDAASVIEEIDDVAERAIANAKEKA